MQQVSQRIRVGWCLIGPEPKQGVAYLTGARIAATAMDVAFGHSDPTALPRVAPDSHSIAEAGNVRAPRVNDQ